VLGLEVSRLARNSADWQRLLELCALTDTLILDEDGLYDCNDFNDRLLLGLKGTMSEAELHFLRARLRGGILSKAQRGELASPLPVGFVYAETGQVRLDPDPQTVLLSHRECIVCIMSILDTAVWLLRWCAIGPPVSRCDNNFSFR
jgi:DNA invertase Pin-like site-specific DNA recombinase